MPKPYITPLKTATSFVETLEPSGTGSTFTRKQRVHELFVHQVPVPQSISDRWAQTWVEEIKALLIRALETLKAEQQAKDSGDV